MTNARSNENRRGEAASEDVVLVAAHLRRVRRRLVSRRATSGVLASAGSLCAAALCVFAADRLTLFPGFLRLAVGAGFAAAAVLLVYRNIFARLFAAPNAAGAASFLEGRFPELEGYALSAAELAVVEGTRSSAGSAAMVRLTVRRARKRLGGVASGEAAPAAPALRPVLFALAAAAGCAAAALLMPADTRVFLKRFMHPLSDIPYPSRTRIVSVEAPRVVLCGEGFTARVVAEGHLPAEAAFHIAGDGGRARQVHAGRGDEGYVLSLQRVRESFTFHVRVADARSEDISVSVVERPRAASLSAEVVYPAYTRQATTKLAGGNVSALAGSAVGLVVELNKPVRSARMLFEGGEIVEGILGEGADAARFDFRVAETTTYRLALMDEYDFENGGEAIYRVRAQEDHAPQARMVRPSRDMTVVPGAVIPVEAEAGDDYGVRFVRLAYRLEREGRDPHKGEIVLAARAPGERRIEVRHRWEVSLLEVEAGDELFYRVEADDNMPSEAQTSSSDERRLEVVTVAEKLAEIDRMHRRIQANLANLQRKQQDTRDNTQAMGAGGERGVR